MHRQRAVRDDAGRRQCLHLRGAASTAGESDVGCGDAAGGGDIAGDRDGVGSDWDEAGVGGAYAFANCQNGEDDLSDFKAGIDPTLQPLTGSLVVEFLVQMPS